MPSCLLMVLPAQPTRPPTYRQSPTRICTGPVRRIFRWHHKPLVRAAAASRMKTFSLIYASVLSFRSLEFFRTNRRLTMSDPFVAEIRIFGFNFAPTGWAQCNGQLLPISQNTALFSLLGTNYGGDGKSNFALPDFQGTAPVHRGQGPGLSERFVGETSGVEFVTLISS